MDSQSLVVDAPTVDAGERLIRQLQADGVDVDAAFWLWVSSDDPVLLVVASPVVDREGKLSAYQRIRQALDELGDSGLTLSDIAAVGNDDPIASSVRTMGANGGPGERARLSIPSPSLDRYASYFPEGRSMATVLPYRVRRDPTAVSDTMDQSETGHEG